MKAYSELKRELRRIGAVQHGFPEHYLTAAPTPSYMYPKQIQHAKNGRQLGYAWLLQKSNGEIIQVLTTRSDLIARV